MPSNGVYELTVASLPHHVRTVRLFVSAVARSAGLDVETIDDAKLAVSEIATAIITAGDLPFITVHATPAPGHLALVVGPWREGLGEGEDFGPLEITQALFEGTKVDGEFIVVPVGAPSAMTDTSPSRLEDLFANRDESEAKRELVETFDGLAQRLARRFGGRGVALDDLVQVARYGLLKAIERFDADRGIQFSTFAGRTIIGEIKHYFRDQAWSVRVPRSLQNLWLEVSRAVDELTHSQGRSPTISEIAEQLDVPEEEVLEALDAGAAYTASSLDRTIGEEGDTTVVDQIGDVDPGYETAAIRRVMSAELQALPERERTVLYLRFFDGRTQAEIADEIGVSQVHVSRILSRTLDQLREAVDPEIQPEPGDSDV